MQEWLLQTMHRQKGPDMERVDRLLVIIVQRFYKESYLDMLHFLRCLLEINFWHGTYFISWCRDEMCNKYQQSIEDIIASVDSNSPQVLHRVYTREEFLLEGKKDGIIANLRMLPMRQRSGCDPKTDREIVKIPD